MVEAIVAIPAVFAAAAVLLLERRCLGQIAFVQPLVLCVAAGYLGDTPEVGLWLGVCLQLFSVGHGQNADWALAGFVGAAALLAAGLFFGIGVEPGTPVTLAVLAAAVVVGIAARLLERRLARTDGAVLRASSPWDGSEPIRALERLAMRRIARGIAIGGGEGLVGAALAVAAMYAASFLGEPPDALVSTARFAVPGLGVAVALGAMNEYRYVAYAAAGFAAVIAVAASL